MIAFVQGQVVSKSFDQAVIDTGAFGINILMGSRNLEELPAPGAEARVYTFLSVREDAMKLYGFMTQEELDMFRLLITVNKIGPKVALDILSFMTPSDIRMAVLSEDAKTLAKCPGVGAKTAQRIVLDLKDRVDIEKALSDGMRQSAMPYGEKGASGAAGEAAEALAALGFPPAQCLKAISAIEGADQMSTEEIIKEALKLIR